MAQTLQKTTETDVQPQETVTLTETLAEVSLEPKRITGVASRPTLGTKDEEDNDKRNGKTEDEAKQQSAEAASEKDLAQRQEQLFLNDKGEFDFEIFVKNVLDNPSGHHFIFEIEVELTKFVEHPTHQRREIQNLSSYHRLVVHKMAQHFNLDHAVKSRSTNLKQKSIVLFRRPDSRVPDLKIVSIFHKWAQERQETLIRQQQAASISDPNGQRPKFILFPGPPHAFSPSTPSFPSAQPVANSEAAPEEQKKPLRIMSRPKPEATSVSASGPVQPVVPKETSPEESEESLKGMSFEEREEAYARARARIFSEEQRQQQQQEDDDDDDEEAAKEKVINEKETSVVSSPLDSQANEPKKGTHSDPSNPALHHQQQQQQQFYQQQQQQHQQNYGQYPQQHYGSAPPPSQHQQHQNQRNTSRQHGGPAPSRSYRGHTSEDLSSVSSHGRSYDHDHRQRNHSQRSGAPGYNGGSAPGGSGIGSGPTSGNSGTGSYRKKQQSYPSHHQPSQGHQQHQQQQYHQRPPKDGREVYGPTYGYPVPYLPPPPPSSSAPSGASEERTNGGSDETPNVPFHPHHVPHPQMYPQIPNYHMAPPFPPYPMIGIPADLAGPEVGRHQPMPHFIPNSPNFVHLNPPYPFQQFDYNTAYYPYPAK